MKNKAFKISVFSLLVSVVFLLFSACSNIMDDDNSGNLSGKNLNNAACLYPRANVDSIQYSEAGIAKNQTIILSFTKPMDTASVWSSISITDSMGNNLKNNFLKPVWSNDDTTIEIPADKRNQIDLRGKPYMDIYLTLPRTCTDRDGNLLQNAIEHKYRIRENNSQDEIPPVLEDVQGRGPDGQTLFQGEYKIENEGQICLLNHIQTKLSFYVEGNDYGREAVMARIAIKRVYDVNGNAVDEEEHLVTGSLGRINNAGNFFDEVSVDLQDSEYLDGMYKITVNTHDYSFDDSSYNRVFYVIRDTAIPVSSNAYVYTDMPDFTEDGLYTDAATIEKFSNRFEFANITDDIYFASKKTGIVYSQKNQSLDYYLSWGSSSQQGKPLLLTKNEFPEEYLEYRREHLEEDIYLTITVQDMVGNKAAFNSIVPGQIKFFNYELADGSNSQSKALKLNYSNKTGDITKNTFVEEKNVRVSYRIYYGKLEKGLDETRIKLKRAATLDTTGINGTEASDLSTFEIDASSDYIVYIQSQYSLAGKLGAFKLGNTWGPLYKIKVEADDQEYESLTAPVFTVSKEPARSAGAYDISVKIMNPQKGYSYYPCWSTDSVNWQIFEELSFTVENPLAAPLNDEQWAQSFFDNGNASYFSEHPEYSTKAYVKVLAVEGQKSVYSDDADGIPYTLVFTEEDDNLPPVQTAVISAHNSRLNSSGHYFSFGDEAAGLVSESDLHTLPEFKYYYTRYNESWGDRLSVLTEEEIKELPSAASTLQSRLWINKKADGQFDSLAYSLTPVIPVNGLKDGNYMFFAQVYDKYGNSGLITLGKANIGTFKNKLTAEYVNGLGLLRLSMERDKSQPKLDRYFMNVESPVFNETSNSNVHGQESEWKGLFTSELQKNNILNKEYLLDGAAFYRFNIQGYNEADLQSETLYDKNTDEMVSNSLYYYVPFISDKGVSELDGFKCTFFKNTASFQSNKPALVNIISSLTDLGQNIDEWERRGKPVKTLYFDGKTANTFSDRDLINIMNDSKENGLRYYVAVYHFANNTSEISNVYTLDKKNN